MLNGAGLHGELRDKLWAECGNTATIIDGLMVSEKTKKPRYTSFFKRDSGLVKYLRRFGEIGIMTKKDGIQSKLKNKGVPVLFLGYAADHAPDTYRVLNLETHRVVLTRDVNKWLNLSYQQWNRKGNKMVMFSADEDEKIELDDDDEEMDKVQEEAEEAENEEIEIVFEREDEEPEEEAPDPNPRLERELARLQDYNAPGNMDDMMVHDENERIFTRSQARREKNDDEVANLAASIFGSDFAMVAKTEVFLEDKPEGMKEQLKLEKKHLLEQLEETKSDKQ
eukprot:scaffold765_cov59-Cylindrotheca_fusiformis.AAC.1